MRKLILGLLASLLCVACAKNTPEQATESLYGALLKDGMTTTLDASQVERIKPRLSRALAAAFDNAIAYTREQEKLACGKPDFGDGYGLRSYSSDAFSAFTVVQAQTSGERARVEVDFTMPDSPGRPDVHIKDTVLLVQEDGQWKLDDVLRDGDAEAGIKAELLGVNPANLTPCPTAAS